MSPRSLKLIPLRGQNDFRNVRRSGRSYVHSLVVLLTCVNRLPISRFGFIASKSVGPAVARNRAKRLLREGVRAVHLHVAVGWDVVLIARPSLVYSAGKYVNVAVHATLSDANLMCEENG